MKWKKTDDSPFSVVETPREKWRRKLLSRRVDAKGMEPIRLRVRALREQRRVGHEMPR